MSNKRYSGSVIVTDEDGETVHERELELDEIIDELLTAPREEEEEEPAPAPKRKYKKRAEKPEAGEPKKKRKSPANRKPCDECGSIGARHFKTCSRFGVPKADMVPLQGATEVVGEREIDKDRTLSLDDWSDIKEQHDDGMAMGMIRMNYKQYEEDEMRRAVGFDTYEAYLEDAKSRK